MKASAEKGARPESAVSATRRGAVGIVTLNRSPRTNAITEEVRAQLTAALEDLDAASQAPDIVVRGGAAGGCCLGADIAPAAAPVAPVGVRRRMMGDHWIHAFDQTKQPSIAASHGFCQGGGLDIA